MQQWVEIEFDCLPLRTLPRLDVPLDASPKFRRRCELIQRAIERHGTHNSYFLYNARCAFHLTNREDLGLIEFRFEGAVLTDETDCQARTADLETELTRETCDWLTEPVRQWFVETVSRAVCAEFNRYIAAGDLEKARERVQRIQAESEEAGGFVGMYL